MARRRMAGAWDRWRDRLVAYAVIVVGGLLLDVVLESHNTDRSRWSAGALFAAHTLVAARFVRFPESPVREKQR